MYMNVQNGETHSPLLEIYKKLIHFKFIHFHCRVDIGICSVECVLTQSVTSAMQTLLNEVRPFKGARN